MAWSKELEQEGRWKAEMYVQYLFKAPVIAEAIQKA